MDARNPSNPLTIFIGGLYLTGPGGKNGIGKVRSFNLQLMGVNWRADQQVSINYSYIRVIFPVDGNSPV